MDTGGTQAIGVGEWVIKKTYYYGIMALLIVLGVSLPFIIRARGNTFLDRFLVAFQGLIIVTVAAWMAAKSTLFMWNRRKSGGN